MAFFVVTYDLRKKGEFDYQPLWDELSHMDAVKFKNQTISCQPKAPAKKSRTISNSSSTSMTF